MNRKKMMVRIAVPAAIVLVISLLILVFQFPYRSLQNKKRIRHLNRRIEHLTTDYHNILEESGGKITEIPVDPLIISEIQSRLYQDDEDVKLYCWMVNDERNVVFGVPSSAFNRLNVFYNKYSSVIENDGYYMDRNDFLLKLIDKYDKIDFQKLVSVSTPEQEQFQWRFYEEKVDPYYYDRIQTMVLSVPVIDDAERYLGELYLKIDDSSNDRLYYSRRRAENYDIYSLYLLDASRVFLSISIMILVFLLPTWVYLDARARGVKNPGIWSFLSIGSFGFGIIVYLLIRPGKGESLCCPECDKELNGTRNFCPYCGFDLSSTFCPRCQYPIKAEWSFCPSCQAEVKHELKDEKLVEKEEK